MICMDALSSEGKRGNQKGVRSKIVVDLDDVLVFQVNTSIMEVNLTEGRH